MVYVNRMASQHEPVQIAVIGAGVIGCTIAWSLAQEGRSVLLLDRCEPGRGGASYGNAGHIATELVEPVPSLQLLFGFWRELFAFGGPLTMPLKRLPQFAPWARRFTAAALRRERNTGHLAPLVKAASDDFHALMASVGRPELLQLNGHYHFWTKAGGAAKANAEARHMERLGIRTHEVDPELSRRVAVAAQSRNVAGLWFSDSGHVRDPLEVCRALIHAATQRGTTFRRADVRALNVRGDAIELTLADSATVLAASAIVCAGAWSVPLLAPFSLNVPLESARGYHVEMPEHPSLVDAPVLYVDQRTVVTPMSGRVRATSFMEFEAADAPADGRKPAHLRRQLRQLGYRTEDTDPTWVGARPVLPDYLPGIGRAPDCPRVLYALGHQLIGLTLAPITGKLIADLVAGRQPRHDVSAFDLRRFDH